MVFKTIFEIPIKAPVFPAEITAFASPDLTASIANLILESLFLKARDGLSSPVM